MDRERVEICVHNSYKYLNRHRIYNIGALKWGIPTGWGVKPNLELFKRRIMRRSQVENTRLFINHIFFYTQIFDGNCGDSYCVRCKKSDQPYSKMWLFDRIRKNGSEWVGRVYMESKELELWISDTTDPETKELINDLLTNSKPICHPIEYRREESGYFCEGYQVRYSKKGRAAWFSDFEKLDEFERDLLISINPEGIHEFLEKFRVSIDPWSPSGYVAYSRRDGTPLTKEDKQWCKDHKFYYAFVVFRPSKKQKRKMLPLVKNGHQTRAGNETTGDQKDVCPGGEAEIQDGAAAVG